MFLNLINVSVRVEQFCHYNITFIYKIYETIKCEKHSLFIFGHSNFCINNFDQHTSYYIGIASVKLFNLSVSIQRTPEIDKKYYTLLPSSVRLE